MRAALEMPQEGMTRRALANSLLPGLYAWVTTVAYPVTAPRASNLTRLTAAAAVVALVLGGWLALRRPTTGRLVGVAGFVGLSAITWLLLGDQLGADRVEPARAAMGAMAWMLFAFGWGAVRQTDAVPEDDPRAITDEVLEPRRRLPPAARAVFGVALGLGLAPVLLAWRVDRNDHALLGHAAAFAAAVSMVTVGAIVAVERGSWRPHGSARLRLGRAAGPLAAVAVLTAVGVIYRWVS